MAKQYVYNFNDSYGLGKELLGGKGAGLAVYEFCNGGKLYTAEL